MQDRGELGTYGSLQRKFRHADRPLVVRDHFMDKADIYIIDSAGMLHFGEHGVHDLIHPPLVSIQLLRGIGEPVSYTHLSPLAVLSEKHQPLFNYFKQLFAQVTNPPIDAIREEIVTSTTVYVGEEGNILEETPENCKILKVENPILTERCV